MLKIRKRYQYVLITKLYTNLLINIQYVTIFTVLFIQKINLISNLISKHITKNNSLLLP
jgi:hypothetical protein